MTIAQLKQILATVDDRLEVVLSKDPEGNRYSPLAQLTFGHYTPRSTWAGDLEFCALNDATAVCLWPRA